MALGIFTGSMPILPFQIAWPSSSPLSSRRARSPQPWAHGSATPQLVFPLFLQLQDRAAILHLPDTSDIFSSIMTSVQNQDEGMVIAEKIMSAEG